MANSDYQRFNYAGGFITPGIRTFCDLSHIRHFKLHHSVLALNSHT